MEKAKRNSYRVSLRGYADETTLAANATAAVCQVVARIMRRNNCFTNYGGNQVFYPAKLSITIAETLRGRNYDVVKL